MWCMKGNVVIGFTTNSYLMLDCDLQREEDVLRFAEEYAKFHKLGSSLVMETSNPKQMELDLKHLLKNFCVIFGKRIAWEENKWHVKEAYRLGWLLKDFSLSESSGLRLYGLIRRTLVFPLRNS